MPAAASGYHNLTASLRSSARRAIRRHKAKGHIYAAATRCCYRAARGRARAMPLSAPVSCVSWRTANLVGCAASAPAANVQTKTAGQTPGRFASVIAERLQADRSVVTIVDCDNDAEHDGQDCQSGDQEPTAGQAFAFNISGCTHISGGGLRR